MNNELINNVLEDNSENIRAKNNFLSIQNLEKIYPNGAKAVFNFDIDINKNEFIVIVGPSGCGKTTTLRMIAGLEDISSGDIYLNNELLNYRPSKDRNIAIVFQSYALYPQMTVFENIAFPLTINKYPFPVVLEDLLAINEVLNLLSNDLEKAKKAYEESLNKKAIKIEQDEYLSLRLKISLGGAILLIKCLSKNKDAETLILELTQNKEKIEAKLQSDGVKYNDKFEVIDENGKVVFEDRKMNKFEIKKKVYDTAATLDLGDYLDRLPKELSGGQMQRVALGRAIVKNVPLFLMDEPLSNLDAKLRLVMRSEIVKLHNLINATTIYVTHDQTEAMTMATRIVVMSRGFVQQIGSPSEIYDNPKNLFVAKFIGSPSINVFEGTYDNKGTINFNDTKVKLSKEIVSNHDNFYQQTLETFNNIDIEFDDKSSEFILKILSALSDEKKVVERQTKPHFFTKLLSLFKKKEREEIDVNKHEREKRVCEQKIDELMAVKENEHQLLVAVRPEKLHIRLIKENEEIKENEIKVTVTVSELLGSEYHAHFDFAGRDMVAKFDKSECSINVGDVMAVSFNIKDAFIFDPITGGRIN